VEEVFRALADSSRRLLLDRLYDRDGQTLSELETHLPQMTRFGVMKHLKVLEDAGLVTTRRSGREKHHFLNPVPIRQLSARWLDRYTARAAGALIHLKTALEESPVAPKVFQILIRTTPDKLWAALTQGEFTRQYYFATSVESTWEKGAPYTYKTADGNDMLVGEVLEADPPHRLVMTFDPRWTAEPAPPSTTTFEIEDVGEVCKLTLVHEGLPEGSELLAGVTDGWVGILSSLKSLLETGEPLPVAAS
jgi:uncharacterized protein YndB with AHSA1/START domain/DNA-binding transcriptional ArsR family regulator